MILHFKIVLLKILIKVEAKIEKLKSKRKKTYGKKKISPEVTSDLL